MIGKLTRLTVVCSACFLTSFAWSGLTAQAIPQTISNRLAIARDFLRIFYPELSGKGYVLTLQSSLLYDQKSDAFDDILEISVRDGRPPNPPGVPASQPILSSGFHFDRNGNLASFSAHGSAIGDAVAKAAMAKLEKRDENIPGAELIAAMKRVGALYGPDDKERSEKDLPIASLETFLGKLRVISVEFAPYLEKDRSNFNSLMEWEVRVVANRRDGTTATYRLQFEQYKGALVSLCDVATYPCNVWESLSENNR
jgi:hypothetical protein